MKSKYPMVMVTWDDSVSAKSVWEDPLKIDKNELLKAMACLSCGLMVDNQKDFISLATSMGVNGQVNNRLTIPRKAIRQVRHLEVRRIKHHGR